MGAPDTEKLSVNMSIMDLGQMDLLIDQGYYSNRTDFVRTAVRNLLQTHAPAVQQQVTSRLLALGVVSYNKKILERCVETGKKLDINLVGVVTISNDVTPELALRAIKSIKVFGTLRAPEAVKKALESLEEEH